MYNNMHWQISGFMGLCIGLTVMLGLNRWKKKDNQTADVV